MRAQAPGRVNLIGDHTDYTGGLVLPMAIDRRTVVDVHPGGDHVELTSDIEPEPASVGLDVADPGSVHPAWARFVAGVVAVVQPVEGGRGTVRTTVPVGAGLSSSAALELAVALALGFTGTPLELALACQRAEHLATGVPTGIMDQLVSASGQEGHALLIDCRTYGIEPVPVPEGADVVVVHSGQPRTLAGSAYAERADQCRRAEEVIGPLRDAGLDDLPQLTDPLLRRRARHVISENARVLAFAEALRAGDLVSAGEAMVESHHSLRDDYEVSTPVLDNLVARLLSTSGVYGARLTGAGFGGCVVALTEPGATSEGWMVRPSSGATVSVELEDGVVPEVGEDRPRGEEHH